MKKFLVLIFSSALILGACSNDDTYNKDSDTKSGSKTEKKSNDSKKEKKHSKKKDDKKSTEENNQSSKQNTNDQQQSTEQPTQQSQQTQQQASQSNHEPTKEEIAEWDRQNVKGGTDYGLIDPEEANKASKSQNNEPDEWVKGQQEWANATQSEKEEIRKRDAEKYGYKYNPNDYEE
ncbi:hypothetical protein K4R81_01915 [Staphylococcus epidermidis]|nr:hypothetical protein [Staphylococcus epidermidis]MCG1362399.1 hypothetical protein [Staphylococcus epidermidis]MCG1737667.1 hypothetical protein [Staphylococcus epidermidis]MCG1964271.1 hypothetical protein [Staphylococcus epidermidis]